MHRVPLLLLTLLMSMSVNAAPEALEAHRWKHRLILVQVNDDPSREQLRTQWQKQMAGVKDRDLVIIDLSTRVEELEELERAERPKAEALAQIRKWAGVEKATSSFVLVGKDGGIKARQTDKLDLAAFFALIDTMPMRQREMLEQE